MRALSAVAYWAMGDARIAKTVQLLLVAILSFGLGQTSSNFRYGTLSWLALLFGLLGVALLLFTLIRGIWKPEARQ